MLAVLGDLVEDLVVVLGGPIQLASDTESHIVRRRGGSAANVAATAAANGWPVRFFGQVGNDTIGTALVDELSAGGVDTRFVVHDGSTGTIIVLVDEHGERSMLTDRKSCRSLDRPDPAWLDGVHTLHIPLYGFAGGSLTTTARTLTEWAHQRGVAVGIDASSVSLIEALGVAEVRALILELAPDVLLANEAEAAVLELDEHPLADLTVVKHGGAPAVVRRLGEPEVVVPAETLDHVRDSTAAGDAFAAGFLTADWRHDPIAACRAGHLAAAEVLRSR